jgi:alpha-1,3-rhamnosyl/mannosyltransferase
LSPLGKSVDIFHASNQLRNPPKNTRVTATLFDMTCWLMPETHSAANVAATKRYAERVMRPARGLISISGQSRDDAVRILGLDPGRITVIYPGIAEAYFEATVEMGSVTAARYGLHRPYLLFVGTVEPRKNIGVLLDAWQLMPPALREAFELVVVGSPGWGDPIVLKRLRAGAGGVRYLGYVPEADLPALTKAAAVFVYPSLYEGFGLPVGQAMAAGVPVVTSSVSCLPEVAGGAAVLADPRSAEEVRSAMVRLLESPERRASLGETGALRARQEFRWEVCAQRSWEFFENLA